MAGQHAWWQTGVIYQIYPRSFMDGNNDGTGDLPGIASKLDYLRWLGIDAIWLSPIYPSPMADFGYDVTNYTGIDPLFGTLDDFDRLLAEAHRREIKVVLDLVPNHTSDEHPWFAESRASRDSPKRDWYIWRDPAPGGGPPNNWQSAFGGGPAWTYEAATDQYYLHLYDPKQPDLNWRNPAVRGALYDVMRFWLDRGVDGFRVDVITGLIKDDQFRDNPPNPEWREGGQPWKRQVMVYNDNRPEVHEVIREMRAVVDAYPGRVLIGETYLPPAGLASYYGAALDEVHLPFNFRLLDLAWEAPLIRAAVDVYEAALPAGAWPNWVLDNHDRPRIRTRAGGEAQARVAQMLLLSLRGTPTCYYGDEIGMHDVPIPPQLVRDPLGVHAPAHGRDPARTPMQWDAGPHAGFSAAEPWLPIADDYRLVNVAAERDDPRSMLALFRRLIALRRALASLAWGSYRALDVPVADALAYLREADGRRILVALNLSPRPQRLDLAAGAAAGIVLCSTHLDREDSVDLAQLALRGHEGLIVDVTP